MVAGAHEPVGREHMPGTAVQIGLRHKVVQVAGVHHVQAMVAGVPDGLVQIMFTVSHPLHPPGCQGYFLLVVARIRPDDVCVRHVQHTEGLRCAKF